MDSRLARIRSRLRMGLIYRPSKKPAPAGLQSRAGRHAELERSGSDSRIPVQHPALVEQVGRAVEGEHEVTTHGVSGEQLGGAGRLRAIGAQQLAEHRRVTGRGAL